jgi:nucleotide-binding universal stress UspA family protein
VPDHESEAITMFKKILLPVDLSKKHQQAVDTAAELARQSGGEVVVLHVIEVIPGLSMEEEKDFYSRLEKAAQKHVTKLAAHLKSRQVAATTEILYGNRGWEIVHYATGRNVDLILFTAPRPDPSNPASGWGSLSYKISVLSPCPVLLVKMDAP